MCFVNILLNLDPGYGIFSSVWRGVSFLLISAIQWMDYVKILSRPMIIFIGIMQYVIKRFSQIKKTLIFFSLHIITAHFKCITLSCESNKNRTENPLSSLFHALLHVVVLWNRFYKLWDLIRGQEPIWFINMCRILFKYSEIKSENHFLMLSIPLWKSILKCRKYNSM